MDFMLAQAEVGHVPHPRAREQLPVPSPQSTLCHLFLTPTHVGGLVPKCEPHLGHPI